MRLAERISGTVLIALALFWAWNAMHLRKPLFLAPGAIGPSAYPLLVSGALFALSGLLVWKSFGERRPAGTDDAGAGGKAPFSPGELREGVLPVAAAFLAYLLLLGVLGYILSTFLFIVAVGGLLRTRPGLSATAGMLVTAVLYGLFHLWLGVPLPRGPLGW
ncbi:tripartite tricarboxylate transporter TctB family protein [Limnochorda pilosa]|uniref:Tricarboxylic transport membrane protein n=1 Tax=Limnochorda pilosa TaxID=1555112 RepID=A0A0K2SGX6_LIMPI|nr:tripartite tricarboxylate transporter TctB family protein [Limnochorda pilosa]BAS26363.1 tricarboxylic transport membrane protein [Limnochorda pilosa]